MPSYNTVSVCVRTGNELFKKGDANGAKNAFTAGIQLDPKMYAPAIEPWHTAL